MRMCAQYRSDNDVVEINSTAGYIRFGIKCSNVNATTYRWKYEVFEASTGNRYTKPMMKQFSENYCEGRLGSSSKAKYTMAWYC